MLASKTIIALTVNNIIGNLLDLFDVTYIVWDINATANSS